MKNRTLVTKLRQFNPELNVSIRTHLQNGCEEKGYGSGTYSGCDFSQDYTIDWNDGYLSADTWDGITVQDVIDVLLEKTLSKIGNSDFDLRPGELRNGYPQYDTQWSSDEPEDGWEDSEIYNIMEIGDTTYHWKNAKSIDFEIHYVDDLGDDDVISFSLSVDESDRKPDPLEKKPTKKVGVKKKAAKKK